jgi:hypothetical protein
MIMNRRVTLSAIALVIAIGGVAVGFSMSPGANLRPIAIVPVAHAIDCQSNNDACEPGDNTKTSVLIVKHQDGNEMVIPNTGETWDYTVTWNSAANCQTDHVIENGSVTVDWNGSAWVVTTFNGTADVHGASLCDYSTSCGVTSRWKGYRLLLNIEDHFNDGNAVRVNLDSVDYSTASVDNGTLSCFGSGSVTPTSQSWNATDDPGNWDFNRCSTSCGVVTGGPTVTITYN